MNQRTVMGTAVLLGVVGCIASAAPLALWYGQPATRWLEALPVGNGRIGAMVFGGVTQERLALNEATFWSGVPSTEHENPLAAEAFARIWTSFKTGNYDVASSLIDTLLGRQLNYGTNLPAGDLLLTQNGTQGKVRDYRRELNLDEAMVRVSFSTNGVHFRREVLASHASGVLALRLSADQPGAIGFTLRYEGWRFPWKAEVRAQDTLAVRARAFEKKHSDGESGVTLQARFRVVAQGGKVTSDVDMVRVSGADAATVFVTMNTDFQGGDPAALCDGQLAAVQGQAWTQVVQRHGADYQPLFRRVTLDLGGGDLADRPTDIRQQALRQGEADPALAALFFQYGRNGQLTEWVHRDDGGETSHRHTSHLVGLFPLAQITPRTTPDLARAAARSLALRMNRPDWEDVEWSAGNAVCYYARLGRGDMAHKYLLNLMTADTDVSLMTFSRGGIAGAARNIFCIDGNTSGAAGIAEMLVQSHAAEIDLLPALPQAWPSGTVKGLRARGGFEVSVSWADGRLTWAQVTSSLGRRLRVRYGERTVEIKTKAQQILSFDEQLNLQ